MPEIAEIRLMRDFINQCTANKKFTRIEKNSVNKNPDLSSEISERPFRIFAKSRGKELQLRIISAEMYFLTFTMGMSGNWYWKNPHEDFKKHTHLMFHAQNGGVLCLQDVRRFARWKWRDWNWDRGPCPLEEPQEFIENFVNLQQDPKFQNWKLYELLMNQKICNGVGNYLRAEILGRYHLSPETKFADLDNRDLGHLLHQIITCCGVSYQLGGGELQMWNNPDRAPELKEQFQEWMQFYGNKTRCVKLQDKSGRTFWIEKKWITKDLSKVS